MLNPDYEGLRTPRPASAFTHLNTPRHLRADGVVREQQPHHFLTQPVVGEFYGSKKQLLAAIKDRLQIVYDAKRITRDEFVAIAKNTYRVLASTSRGDTDDGAEISFSTSWNDAALDMALKLQLELLGVMWPPIARHSFGSKSRSSSVNSTHVAPKSSMNNDFEHLGSAPQSDYPNNASVVSRRPTTSNDECMTPLGRLACQGTRPPSPTEANALTMATSSSASADPRDRVLFDSHRRVDSISGKSIKTPHDDKLERLRSHHRQLALEGLLKESAQRIVNAATSGISAKTSGSAHSLPSVKLYEAVSELENKQSLFRLRLEKFEAEDRAALQGLCMSRLIELLTSVSRRTTPESTCIRRSSREADERISTRVSEQIVAGRETYLAQSEVSVTAQTPSTTSEDDDDDDDDLPPCLDPPPCNSLVVTGDGSVVPLTPPPKYAQRAFGPPATDTILNALKVPSKLTPEGLRALYAAAARQEFGAQRGRDRHRSATPPPIKQQLPSTPLRIALNDSRRTPPARRHSGHSHIRDINGGLSYADPYATIALYNDADAGSGHVDPSARADMTTSTRRATTPSRQLAAKGMGRSPKTTSTPVRREQARAHKTSSSPFSATMRRKSTGSLTQASSHYPSREEVVEHVRELLQPVYNTGLLPADAFASVVRYVSQQLTKEGIPAGYQWQDVVSLLVQEGCEQVGLLE